MYKYIIWAKKSVCFLLLLTVLTRWLSDRGSLKMWRRKRPITNFFLLQKNLKLLSSYEQYTGISLKTERCLTWGDQHSNWDNSQTKKNPLSPNLYSQLFWLPPSPWIISQDFNLPTQTLSALASNILCSHCCGHSAQRRRIINLWDKIWHHKNLFSHICFFLHCAMLPDLMFEGMTKGWEMFKHVRG